MGKLQEIGETDSSDLPDMLSDEVMAALRISRRTLDRWVTSGRLPAVQPGGPRGTRRYPRHAVEALKRGEVPS